MRFGVRIGIDVGKARVGVSSSDAHGMLATPVETVQRDPRTNLDVARILELARDLSAIEIIVGLPLNMRGEYTASTEDAVAFAKRLARESFDVRLLDERLSTVSAWGQLHASGRKTKGSKGVIDQAAAVVILQHALDSERAQGVPVGTLVQDDSTPTGKS